MIASFPSQPIQKVAKNALNTSKPKFDNVKSLKKIQSNEIEEQVKMK